MTDLRKAAEMALEVLERASDAGYSIECEEAITALRQALAQPEPEPVAYADALDLAKDCNWDTFICKHSSENHEGTRFKIPLYTASPKREWVGLTDDEIKKIMQRWRNGYIDIKNAEQLLKDKNI